MAIDWSESYLNGSVTVGIWAKKAGVWQLITYDYVYINEYLGYGGGPGTATTTWYLNGSYDLGPGVQAVGVTVEGYDGIGADVQDFTSLQFATQASSSERSAAPSGQVTNVTVFPQ